MSEEKRTEKKDLCEISTLCMNITRLGCLLCIGYDNGEIYIYNISTGEPVMVNALLLLCFDPSFDGILFVGYNNGYIEALNCSNGKLMQSKDCPSGKPVQSASMDLMRGGSDAYEDYQVQSGGYQMFDPMDEYIYTIRVE